MYNYNYYEAVADDVKELIRERYELESVEDAENLDASEIEEMAFNNDSVTGNASGSYTLNRYDAMQYVTDNIDILEEAVRDGFATSEQIGDWFLANDFEPMDVTIRCYVLPIAIEDAIQAIIDDFEGVQA